MAESTSSQLSPLCVFSFPDSFNKTTPRNKDQLIFQIRVSTCPVSRNPMNPNKKSIHNQLAKKTFECSRKAFFSNQTYQRDFLHMMFQNSEIPFCLENIHWGSRFPKDDETAPKLENLDKAVTRILEVARDCPQDVGTLIILVTKYDTILHQDKPKQTRDFRSKQPLYAWLDENMNDVNILHYHKFIYEKIVMKSTADNKYFGLRSIVMGKDDDEEEESCCSICIKEFRKGSLAIYMPCSHVFHGSCIFRWLNVNPKCPLCRFELFPKEESNLDIDFSSLTLNDR